MSFKDSHYRLIIKTYVFAFTPPGKHYDDATFGIKMGALSVFKERY